MVSLFVAIAVVNERNIAGSVFASARVKNFEVKDSADLGDLMNFIKHDAGWDKDVKGATKEDKPNWAAFFFAQLNAAPAQVMKDSAKLAVPNNTNGIPTGEYSRLKNSSSLEAIAATIDEDTPLLLVVSSATAATTAAPSTPSATSSSSSFPATPISIQDEPETDVFLTHTWVEDEEKRKNHERVSLINDHLKAKGIRTWFDGDRMRDNIVHKMTNGIDKTKVVVVCISKAYMNKLKIVGDNCAAEFSYAVNRKGLPAMIAVVMEKSMRNTKLWDGPLSLRLGDNLFIDLADDPMDVDRLVKALADKGIGVAAAAMKQKAENAIVATSINSGAGSASPSTTSLVSLFAGKNNNNNNSFNQLILDKNAKRVDLLKIPRADFLKAIELIPENGACYGNLGLFLDANESVELNKSGGRMTKQQLYLKAIEIDPNYARAYHNLGATLPANGSVELNSGKMTKQQLYLKTIELDPNYVWAYFNLATTLPADGSIELNKNGGRMTTQQLFLKTIELEPSYAFAYNGVANSMPANGSVELPNKGGRMTQQQLYLKAIDLNPTFAGTYIILADTLPDSGRITLNDGRVFTKEQLLAMK